jgi:hypothetical protein
MSGHVLEQGGVVRRDQGWLNFTGHHSTPSLVGAHYVSLALSAAEKLPMI